MNTIPNYDILLEKILYNIDTYSGTHAIDPDKAQQWINAQPTKESRLAAKKLIEVTDYITYKEVFAFIEKLVKTEYKKIAKTEKKIYMYLGNPDDSNYFISILALYFIKQYGYREPDQYFEEIPDGSVTDANAVLLYFDDMAYSGGQIIGNITKIYKTIIIKKIVSFMRDNYNLTITIDDRVTNPFNHIIIKMNAFYKTKSDQEADKIKMALYKYIKKSKYCNIVYLLLGINEISYDRIMNISLIHFINDSFSKIIDNVDNIELFKLNYKIKCVKIYPTIEKLCSEEELFYMTYFFSFGKTPVVSIYYDHKISNSSSTFLRVLNFGPVVPANFDVSHYWKPFKYITTKEGYELAKTVKIESKSEIYLRFIYLCHKYYKLVENNNREDITRPIKCIPFINNCYNIEKILNNPLMKQIDYFTFISNFPKLQYFPKPNIDVLTKQYAIVNGHKTPFVVITDYLYYKYGSNTILRNRVFYFLKDIMIKEACNFAFYKNSDYAIMESSSSSSKKYTKRTYQKKHKNKSHHKTQRQR
jgi:hypothetical protein